MTDLVQGPVPDANLGPQICPECGVVYPPQAVRCSTDSALLPHWASLIDRTVADRYIVQDLIAIGGMAVVYQARQKVVNRPVALKILRTIDQLDEASRRAFFTEARVISRLRHPNIVTLFDFGQLRDNRFFMALEYIDGQSLSARLQNGPLPLSEMVNIGTALCAALEEAHRLGVVHRDVKPDNVMLKWIDGQWSVRLVDFGIAQHAVSGMDDAIRLGTPEYASPEVLTGQPIDYRADLYALGLVLFEMATGHPPFDGTPQAIAQHHATSDAPRPSEAAPMLNIDARIDTLIAQLLKKEPDERPASASVVAQQLRTIQQSTTVAQSSQSAGVSSSGERQLSSIRSQPASPTNQRPDAPQVPDAKHRDTNPLGSAVTSASPTGPPQLPRWRYIVLLGLVSAAAIGVVQLQRLTQDEPANNRRPILDMDSTRPSDHGKVTIARERIYVNRQLGDAVLTAVRPSPIPADQKSSSPNRLIDPGTLAELKAVTKTTYAGEDRSVNAQRARLILSGIRRWQSAHRIYGRALSEYHRARTQWQQSSGASTPKRPRLDYSQALEDFEAAQNLDPGHRTTPALLALTAHAYGMSENSEGKQRLARSLLNRYALEMIPDAFVTMMADFAYEDDDWPRAHTLYTRLMKSSDEQEALYAAFMLAFIDYARDDFNGALNRSFITYDTLKKNREAYPILGPQLLRLIVLSSVRSHQDPKSIRSYLRAQGGPALARDYLPLLAWALERLGRWDDALRQYTDLIHWHRAEDQVGERQEWALAQQRLASALGRYHLALERDGDEATYCQSFQGYPNRRGECLVIVGRSLLSIGAPQQAKLALSEAVQLANIWGATTPFGDAQWPFEARLRLHDLAGRNGLQPGASDQKIRRRANDRLFRQSVQIYQDFLDAAPAHWQAVAYDRLSRLHEARAKTLAKPSAEREEKAMAKALRERGGIRLNTSSRGIDWLFRLAP
ncbi:MAG: serine/threonine-protein kinase [Myxococcota bacterium]|nr:serine/threonine-protein kinase [Myxococcota bacterium]